MVTRRFLDSAGLYKVYLVAIVFQLGFITSDASFLRRAAAHRSSTAGRSPTRLPASSPPEAPPVSPARASAADGQIALGNRSSEAQDDMAIASRSLAQQVGELATWAQSSATLQELEFVNQFRGWLRVHRGQPGSIEKLTDELGRMNIPEDWADCSSEGGTCKCASGKARFGLAPQWTSKPAAEPFSCSLQHFGTDPAPGRVKVCQCYALAKVVTCHDGSPVNWGACAAGIEAQVNVAEALRPGEDFCREGCAHAGPPASSESFCPDEASQSLLWSCKGGSARKHRNGNQSSNPAQQPVFEEGVRALCADPKLASHLDVFLDCSYKDNYLRLTQGSDWLPEAYVTYLGGKRNSDYEWMGTNLIRSVHLFSKRPIVVVVFDQFLPPLSWRKYPNLLVYKMSPDRSVSFNFNKIRAMISTRVTVGIELDLDQIINAGMDNVFAATRRESTRQYPYPVLPVHWMSRDAKPGEPFHEYTFTGYAGNRTMRWNHGHPTWTFWATPFLSNLLRERLTREAPPPAWMREDEDMLNVKLWQAGVSKAWCKFDLEPDLFVQQLANNTYWDAQWYPTGLPLVFYSTHNSKHIEETDFLLSLFARCADPHFEHAVSCRDPSGQATGCGSVPDLMTAVASQQAKPEAMQAACCCLGYRQRKPIFWEGSWFADSSEVPVFDNKGGKRRCIMP